MVALDEISTRNYREARRIYDAWFDEKDRGYGREDGWVRLVAALDTESKCKILAHTGEWGGGGKINAAQKALLRTSAAAYKAATGRDPDGYGSNGGSVGALQQIPTPVAQAADKPWGGWGSIVECMVLATSIPKFLKQLRVTGDSQYQGKQTASPIVADLLRVQQPLASEVAQNYGASIVARAVNIAAQFPPDPVETDWFADCLKEADMAKYTDPDDFLNRSQVPWGETDYGNPDPAKMDSIRQSLWGSNRFTGIAAKEAQEAARAAKGVRDDVIGVLRADEFNVPALHKKLDQIIELLSKES